MLENRLATLKERKRGENRDEPLSSTSRGLREELEDLGVRPVNGFGQVETEVPDSTVFLEQVLKSEADKEDIDTEDTGRDEENFNDEVDIQPNTVCHLSPLPFSAYTHLFPKLQPDISVVRQIPSPQAQVH